MKFYKKGQAALEFLTTYGWAFLVILVMIGGLSYFGVLDVSKFVPDTCKLDGNIECPTFALEGTNFSLGIKNNLMNDVTILSASIKEKTKSTWNDSAVLSPSVTIAKFQQEDVSFTVPAPGNIGEKKTYDLKVVYTKEGSDIEQTAMGSMTTTNQG